MRKSNNILSAAFDAHIVAAIISKHFPQFKTLKIEEEFIDEFDAHVEMNERLHVQVGETYLIVGLWDRKFETLRQWEHRNSTDAMLADLREAVAEMEGK